MMAAVKGARTMGWLTRAVVCAMGVMLSRCGGSSSSAASSSAGGGGVDSGGAGSPSLTGNAIDGTVMGMRFTTIAASFWVQNPSAGGAPTLLFLLDEKLGCSGISAPGWDKTIAAATQVLEIGLAGPASTTFTILGDADANYLGGPYNPSADSGRVTVDVVKPSQELIGSFDVHFGADALSGTFDATFCSTGVEP